MERIKSDVVKIRAGVEKRVSSLTTLSPSAVKDIEKLAQKRGVNTADERFKVVPDYAYPNTKMNREELREEMNKKSSFFHTLALPNEEPSVGELTLEILQCFGIPKPDLLGETSAFCVAVCGAYAFKTDVMPPVANPMWLSKMRRACVFPIHHAYATFYTGVFGHEGVDKKDGFAGRVAIDIARLRPNCTYDITLPLRQSTHVYSRHQRGAIRLRFHLRWHSEQRAILSYLPRKMPKFKPNESVIVPCCDNKSFQNVSRAIHGDHMPGRFSMNLLKATIREINFTRIHILRYLRKKEFRATTQWENPVISAFVFTAWMHCVYANSVSYIPGHILTFLLLHLWKNYAYYALDSPVQNGFLAPSWEEMMAALLWGKDEQHSYIDPLQMELKDHREVKSAVDDMATVDTSDKAKTIYEIAELFNNGVKVAPLKQRLRTHKRAFRGCDAVDFLVESGIANDRRHAVHIGRRLAREVNLFEHVTRKHLFEDQAHHYVFLPYDATEYAIKTHRPWGKSLFRMLRLLPENHGLTEDKIHLEMPYADGIDHPRFKVKDALVIRSKREQRLLSQEHAGEDAAEELLDSTNMNSMRSIDSFLNGGDEDEASMREKDGEDNEDGAVSEIKVLSKPPQQNMEVKGKSDKKIAEVLMEARYKMHGVLLHAFNDRVYTIDGVGTAAAPSAAANLPEGSAMETANKSRRTNTGLLVPKEKSKKSFPRPVRSFLKSKVISASKDGADPVRVKKDEYERLLGIGKYSHGNPWIAKVGIIVQPLVEMALGWLCLFRALFNVFTWRDPILTFWISLILPVIIVILYLFPWRLVLGILGVVLVGPQNWILRVLRERKPGYVPPDPDVIKKKHKLEVEAVPSPDEIPLFSNEVPDNRPVNRAVLDDSNIKKVVVPYSQLMYQRFYDWPPETEYARVKAELAPENDPIGMAETMNGDNSSVTSRRGGPRRWLKESMVRARSRRKFKKDGASVS